MKKVKIDKLNLAIVAAITIWPVAAGVFLSFILGWWSISQGLIGGLAVGVGMLTVVIPFMLLMIKGAEKKKWYPYIIGAIILTIVLSTLWSFNLGDSTCMEYSDAVGGACIEYADDGFEPTGEQILNAFWGSVPITLPISLAVAWFAKKVVEEHYL